MAIFVPFVNQKGGVGKSTTTVNVAFELARLGSRVLFVDLDPQGTATEAILAGTPTEGTAEVLGYGPDANEEVGAVFERVVRKSADWHLDIVGSNYDRLFSHQDVMKSQNVLQLRLLDLAIALEDRYDVILADCPPNLGPLTLTAIYASAGIVVVVETSEEATKGLSILVRALEGARRMMRSDFPILGAALTKYRAGEVICDDVRAALTATNLFPFIEPITDTKQFKMAFSNNRPLREMVKNDTHRRAVREIENLAMRIETMLPPESADARAARAESQRAGGVGVRA